MAASQLRHTSTWTRVDLFLALSAFMREHLIANLGLRPEQVRVYANLHRDPAARPALDLSIPAYDFVFVGRLDAAKGINNLLEAAVVRPHLRFGIAGDGPLRSSVAAVAAEHTHIKYVGQLPASGVTAFMLSSRAVVIPSTWWEGAPLVLAKALGLGRPLVVSKLGSLASLVESTFALTAEPSVDDLGRALDCMARLEESQVVGMQRAAREHFRQVYDERSAVKHPLLAVYEDVLGRKVERRPSA